MGGQGGGLERMADRCHRAGGAGGGAGRTEVVGQLGSGAMHRSAEWMHFRTAGWGGATTETEVAGDPGSTAVLGVAERGRYGTSWLRTSGARMGVPWAKGVLRAATKVDQGGVSLCIMALGPEAGRVGCR